MRLFSHKVNMSKLCSVVWNGSRRIHRRLQILQTLIIVTFFQSILVNATTNATFDSGLSSQNEHSHRHGKCKYLDKNYFPVFILSIGCCSNNQKRFAEMWLISSICCTSVKNIHFLVLRL